MGGVYSGEKSALAGRRSAVASNLNRLPYREFIGMIILNLRH